MMPTGGKLCWVRREASRAATMRCSSRPSGGVGRSAGSRPDRYLLRAIGRERARPTPATIIWDKLFLHDYACFLHYVRGLDIRVELMTVFWDRIIRAAKLDVQLYEEVEADTGAMAQAMGVVVLSSLAAGVGGAGGGLGGILFGTIAALVGWYIWAYLTYFIGTKFLPEPQTKADLGELLRTIGFSSSPGLLRVLGIIPGLAGLVFLVTSIWMLVSMVIAVRQALDYESTWRAVGVCVIGYIVQLSILLLLLPVLL